MARRGQKYDKLLQRIAGNLKRIRKAKGLTQEGMAHLGFNYRHYQKLESGKHAASLQTLNNLADTLKVDVREFFR